MTAEAFYKLLLGYDDKLNLDDQAPLTHKGVNHFMIQFARMHVKAALKAAAKKANATIEVEYDDQPSSSMPPSEYPVVNKKSILNAYPETLIK